MSAPANGSDVEAADFTVGAPTLRWDDRIPRAAAFDDPYYATDDPVGEVRHTFLDGVDFDALCARRRLTIAETGFGTGLNFLEAWGRWAALAPAHATLDFISVEGYPMTAVDLARAHAPFAHLAPLSTALRAQWPGPVPGVHRLRFAEGRVRLLLLIGEVGACLAEADFRADAWFLDGFAPARNPSMWRQEVLNHVGRLSRPGTKAASFTAAGAVRRGLSEAGFEVAKRPGFGRKRDCLSAVMSDARPTEHASQHTAGKGERWGLPPPPLADDARIAVIGDGVAGRAMADALARAGRVVRLIGGLDSMAYAASTLPRALIAPKLVRGDNPYGRFSRQCFLDAVRLFDGIDPPVWRGPRGLLLPASDARTLKAQGALVAALGWPETELRPVGAAEARALAGWDPSGQNPSGQDSSGQHLLGGLYLPRAGTVDPSALRRHLGGAPAILADIASLSRRGETWVLSAADGTEVAEADAVILCAGAALPSLLPRHDHATDGDTGAFALRRGAGHLARLRDGDPGACAVMRDGYATAVEADGTRTAGATALPHAPLAPVEIGSDSRAALRARIAPLLARDPDESAMMGDVWAGLRCDTADHLPLAGPVPDLARLRADYADLRDGRLPADQGAPPMQPGLWVLGALGARGFQAAPLLADHIAALIDGRVPPLSPALGAAVHPARFAIRDLRRRRI